MATMPSRWRGPRPDPSVLDLIESLKVAAATGAIRGLVVITVNPMLSVEIAEAGELDHVKRDLLIGGCTRAANKLTRQE